MNDVKILSGEGRATRRDYFACSIVFSLAGYLIGIGMKNMYSIGIVGMLFLITFLVLIIWLQIAISIRRLHDMDKEGGLAFLLLIPIVSIGLFFYLVYKNGTKGENKYGIDPRDLIVPVNS